MADLPEAFSAYLDELAARGLAASSLEATQRRLERWRIALTARGCLTVVDVRSEDLDAILLDWQASGLAWSTLRALRGAVRSCFAWLYRQGRVLADPARDLGQADHGREDRLLAPPLTESEILVLMDAVPRGSVVDLRNRLHLELLYGCGLRLNESLELTLDDLDLGRRTLLVHGKGGHERLLPIMSSAKAALEDYLALRRTLLRGPDRGVLLLSRRGSKLGPCGVQQWLAALSQATLGRRVHPHLLRHSIAVHLLRGGADIRHVQDFLGHADLDTTKTYLRLIPGHLREDYDKAMPEMIDAGALHGGGGE